MLARKFLNFIFETKYLITISFGTLGFIVAYILYKYFSFPFSAMMFKSVFIGSSIGYAIEIIKRLYDKFFGKKEHIDYYEQMKKSNTRRADEPQYYNNPMITKYHIEEMRRCNEENPTKKR